MTYFADLRRTVDAHRSPLSEAKLREMSGVSTYVKRAAEAERPAIVTASTMYPIPAELPDAFWEPLRDTHYVYVPRNPEGGDEWPFALRVVEAYLHLERDTTSRKVAGPRYQAENVLSDWLDEHGPEVPDSKVRRLLSQHAPADGMDAEDAQFMSLAALALAATGTDWILWDPFRARVLSQRLDEPAPTRWFLRDEDGLVGMITPFHTTSPTWDPTYAREARDAGRLRWTQDLEEFRRLHRMSAADLKEHLQASGRTKKADLLREWFERPRWEVLYPREPVVVAAADAEDRVLH